MLLLVVVSEPHQQSINECLQPRPVDRPSLSVQVLAFFADGLLQESLESPQSSLDYPSTHHHMLASISLSPSSN